MKRTAAAGTFALLAGGATLLLLASIFYSCRLGGNPHNARHDGGSSSHSTSSLPAAPRVVTQDEAPSVPPSATRLALLRSPVASSSL
jgi:hypothetical protein